MQISGNVTRLPDSSGLVLNVGVIRGPHPLPGEIVVFHLTVNEVGPSLFVLNEYSQRTGLLTEFQLECVASPQPMGTFDKLPLYFPSEWKRKGRRRGPRSAIELPWPGTYRFAATAWVGQKKITVLTEDIVVQDYPATTFRIRYDETGGYAGFEPADVNAATPVAAFQAMDGQDTAVLQLASGQSWATTTAFTNSANEFTVVESVGPERCEFSIDEVGINFFSSAVTGISQITFRGLEVTGPFDLLTDLPAQQDMGDGIEIRALSGRHVLSVVDCQITRQSKGFHLQNPVPSDVPFTLFWGDNDGGTNADYMIFMFEAWLGEVYINGSDLRHEKETRSGGMRDISVSHGPARSARIAGLASHANVVACLAGWSETSTDRVAIQPIFRHNPLETGGTDHWAQHTCIVAEGGSFQLPAQNIGSTDNHQLIEQSMSFIQVSSRAFATIKSPALVVRNAIVVIPNIKGFGSVDNWARLEYAADPTDKKILYHHCTFLDLRTNENGGGVFPGFSEDELLVNCAFYAPNYDTPYNPAGITWALEAFADIHSQGTGWNYVSLPDFPLSGNWLPGEALGPYSYPLSWAEDDQGNRIQTTQADFIAPADIARFQLGNNDDLTWAEFDDIAFIPAPEGWYMRNDGEAAVTATVAWPRLAWHAIMAVENYRVLVPPADSGRLPRPLAPIPLSHPQWPARSDFLGNLYDGGRRSAGALEAA